ncbi:bifunctional diaminohydroxyphosphoribosylaminopyrimidine deaminase/5-amino-6-(5-phosphoribosylamino)uracil reductase RibD [Anaerocellum diazotrophicum]|uniref:Riboflavin biosynthesis protein RibD n=1 Tax=Caldicellulosiruptor diazotrophicus TaxID=2806205 RepID=A0ABM7NP97_9FIRM|nr:bifunctional diaminohydroxyphosphoribosylaminopyrimidine deaminase/5-amino-6-(5-phosphoribosylamino)uracil reductase RibD [Caldicellulosiruptor diazotrophicus]BCS81927.1 riboflavin biosynthesis protein RibD [Caldicellulosiruptor diazotrophicus]
MRTLSHSYYMNIALELAKEASPLVLPNPRVGCVIVKKGTIIGKGYHQKYGEKHAEVLAIEDAIKNGNSLKNATMYVSLEPCCHFGKQPPCTDAIIKSGIKKVVVAIKDPNPLVNGKGIQILKQHGIEVIEGILEKEAESVNKDFFKYMKKGIPYIAIKVAQSIDGKIATPSNKRFLFNTDDENIFVHSLRQKYMATMVSVNTVISDNPILNARYGPIVRQPIRVVLDSKLRIPLDCNIVKTSDKYSTYIVCSENVNDVRKIELLSKKGIKIIFATSSEDGHLDLLDAFSKLAQQKIVSVLVEGGSLLNFSLLKQRVVDYWYSLIFNVFIGGQNTKSVVGGEGFEDFFPKLVNTKVTTFKNSTIIEGDITYV